jgi:hypothetical protein
MGIPLTIQEHDDKLLLELKEFFGAPSKVAVLRMALELLEQERERRTKIARWAQAVRVAKATSKETNSEFRRGSTLGKKVS